MVICILHYTSIFQDSSSSSLLIFSRHVSCNSLKHDWIHILTNHVIIILNKNTRIFEYFDFIRKWSQSMVWQIWVMERIPNFVKMVTVTVIKIQNKVVTYKCMLFFHINDYLFDFYRFLCDFSIFFMHFTELITLP